MKKIHFILLVAVILLQSCSNGSNKTATNDSVTSKEAQATLNTPDTTTTAAVVVDKESAGFAAAAANGGMMEVELGKWAQAHGTDQQVKDFGALMVADHSKANEELTGIARSKNISLPAMVNGEEKENMDKLMGKKGKDFDKAYVNMMIDDHKKDVAEFEKASKDLSDSALKNFAARTLPVLQKHYTVIKAVKSKM